VKLRKGTSRDMLIGKEIERICLLVISTRRLFLGKAVSKLVLFLANLNVFAAREETE